MSFVYRDTLSVKLAKLQNYSKLFARFDGSSKSNYNVAKQEGKAPKFFNGAWKTHIKYYPYSRYLSTDFYDNNYNVIKPIGPGNYPPGQGDNLGVEVYDSRLIFFHDGFTHDEVIKKFVEQLGINWKEFIDQDNLNPVDGMWFYFKSGFIWDGSTRNEQAGVKIYEPTEGLPTPSTADLSDAYNVVYKSGDEIAITISYAGGLKRYINNHDLPWKATGGEIVSGGFNSKGVRDKIMSNPWYYLANMLNHPYTMDSRQFQEYDSCQCVMPKEDTNRPSPRTVPNGAVALHVEGYKKVAGETPPNYLLGLFALMDKDKTVWEPIVDTEGIPTVFDEILTTVSTNDKDGEVLEYKFTYKYIYKGSMSTSKLIIDVQDWYKHFYQDPKDIPINRTERDKYKEVQITSTVDTDFKKALYKVMEGMLKVPVTEVTNSLYFQGCLRVDTLHQMKRKDFARLIATKLDQDYSLDSHSSLFSKVFTAVLIIIAVVVFVLTDGLAAGLLYASLTLAAGQMIVMVLQLPVRQSEMKLIGDAATVTGLASMAVGMNQALNAARAELTKEAMEEAEKEAVRQGVKQGTIEVVKVTTTDVVLRAAYNMVFSMGSSISSAITTASQVISKAVDYFGGKKLDEQQDKISELQEKVDQQADEDAAMELAKSGKIDVILVTDLPHNIEDIDTIAKLDKNISGKLASGKQNELEFYKEICMEVPIAAVI